MVITLGGNRMEKKLCVNQIDLLKLNFIKINKHKHKVNHNFFNTVKITCTLTNSTLKNFK